MMSAARSAAWATRAPRWPAGVVPFGCLQKVTPPADIGEKYSC